MNPLKNNLLLPSILVLLVMALLTGCSTDPGANRASESSSNSCCHHCSSSNPGTNPAAVPDNIDNSTTPNFDTTGWTSLSPQLAGSEWQGRYSYRRKSQQTDGTYSYKTVNDSISSWKFNSDGTTRLVINGDNDALKTIIYEGRCNLNSSGSLKYQLQLKSHGGEPITSRNYLLWGEIKLNLSSGKGDDNWSRLYIESPLESYSYLNSISIYKTKEGPGFGRDYDRAAWTSLPGELAGSDWKGSYSFSILEELPGGKDIPKKETREIISWSFKEDGSSKLITAGSLSGKLDIYEGKANLDSRGKLKYLLEAKRLNNMQLQKESKVIWGELELDLAAGKGITENGNLYQGLPFGEYRQHLAITIKRSAQTNHQGNMYTIVTAAAGASKSSGIATSTPLNGLQPEGSEITVEAKAAEGSKFIGWSDSPEANGSYISQQNPYRFKLTKDTVLYALFELKKFSWSASSSLDGTGRGTPWSGRLGTYTTRSGQYPYETPITAVAVQEMDSIFTGWYDAETGGKLISKEQIYTFKLTKETALYARFDLKPAN